MSRTRDRIKSIASIAEQSVQRSDDDSPRLQAFLRGLSIGALVGAAIAGSAIWERSQRRRVSHEALTAVDDNAQRTKPAAAPPD